MVTFHSHFLFNDIVQWIAECEESIMGLSLSDWRREKLKEGVKLYINYVELCDQETVLQHGECSL